MKLIFIRHGDPDYSIDSLTEKGWREAKLLGQRVATWNDISHIYCSPLGRAKDTASFSLEALHMEATTYDWLQEFIYKIDSPISGEKRIPWDFMPNFWTQIPEGYDKDKWLDIPMMKTGSVAENYHKVCYGLDGILSEYGYHRQGNLYVVDTKKDDKEDTLVFFCHLGVTFVMLGYLLGISPFLLWHTAFIAPTSVTIVNSENREEGYASFRIQALGDTSHLLLGGEPISNSGYFTDCFQK